MYKYQTYAMYKYQTLMLESALLLASATAVHAQPAASAAPKQIPIRLLGPIVASSRDTLGARIIVRALSDGSVLVGIYGAANTLKGQAVKLFDPTLQQVTVLRDSTHVPQLIPLGGDSTVLLDRASRSMVIVDRQGRDARTIALPKLSDFGQLSAFLRTPRFDRGGSLVYQGVTPPPEEQTIERLQQPFLPDSAPLVRGSFDTRRVDTLARIRIAQPARTTFGDHGQNISVDIVLDPTATGDEWTMLSDGSVAIIRVRTEWCGLSASHGRQRRLPGARAHPLKTATAGGSLRASCRSADTKPTRGHRLVAPLCAVADTTARSLQAYGLACLSSRTVNV